MIREDSEHVGSPIAASGEQNETDRLDHADSTSTTSYWDHGEAGGADDADTWLMATVAMIPIAAIIGVIATYTSVGGAWAPLSGLGAGLGVGAVMFVLLLVLYRRLGYNTSQHASVVAYNDLCRRMDRVANARSVLAVADDPSIHVAIAAAQNEVCRYGVAFNFGRRKRGLQWVLGKGYVDLGRIVHRSEEAMMMYEPVDVVMADGLTDMSRIAGSRIPQSDDLLNRVRRAMLQLSPSASAYLPPSTAAPACDEKPLPDGLISAQTQARMMLRQVRYTVNEFRDIRRARLTDARNELVARVFLTALATSCLLVFVVLGRPPAPNLVTGAVIYAVGATVGLFGRLYADFKTDSLADDFALSYVRLFQTFLLSGHAAIAGVFLAVALPLALTGPPFQLQTAVAATSTPVPISSVQAPSQSAVVVPPPVSTPGDVAAAPSPGVATFPTMPPLTRIYSVETNPFSIVLAMVFGLTPGLLISRLSQGIEQDKQDLRSSDLTTTVPV